jgi:tryptophan synthase alpha chain
MKLKNPCLIGFGISDHATFANACKYANGAIIGSAFVKSFDEKLSISDSISSFVNRIYIGI